MSGASVGLEKAKAPAPGAPKPGATNTPLTLQPVVVTHTTTASVVVRTTQPPQLPVVADVPEATPVSPDRPSAGVRPPEFGRGVALYDFKKRNADELDLFENEIVRACACVPVCVPRGLVGSGGLRVRWICSV